MSETAKTLSYLGAAALISLVAFVARPKPPVVDGQDQTARLLGEVDDPLAARQLEIVEYDEDRASIRTFEVAQVGGRWSIPSHSNYPADAEQQMGEAATSVMNRKILGVATTKQADHNLYGVVQPELDLSVGTEGVGTRVTMKDEKGDAMIDVVIGKEVADQDGQRYVREVGKNPVYIVEIDPGKLSTDFGIWIEKDLLKLNTWDVTGLQLNDYSIRPGIAPDGFPTFFIDPRGEIGLDYDDEKSAWSVGTLKEWNKESDTYAAVEIPEGEELDDTKLNDLKNALDDLKIVDVERKPEGLSRDLKVEQSFARDREAIESLVRRGFYPVGQNEQGVEIKSSEGEVICQLKDGVEYVLRFGQIVLGSGGGDANLDAKEGDEKDGSGINRYLFVSARFNEDLLEKPELQELPAAEGENTKGDEAKGAEGKGDETKAEAPKGDATGGDAPKGEPAKEEAAKEAAAKEAAPDGAKGPEGEAGAAQESAVETTEPAADAKGPAADAKAPAADAKGPAADAKGPAAEDGTAAKAPGAEAADGDAAKKAAESADAVKDTASDAEADADKKANALKAAREFLDKQNKAKLDAYQKQVEKGKEHVEELNNRFGDWYYVISDDVYKKIHLGRADIFKKEKKPDEAAETGITPGGLDRLDAKGLDGKGPQVNGPEVKGPEAEGPDAKGPEPKGPEPKGPEPKGPEAKGPESP